MDVSGLCSATCRGQKPTPSPACSSGWRRFSALRPRRRSRRGLRSRRRATGRAAGRVRVAACLSFRTTACPSTPRPCSRVRSRLPTSRWASRRAARPRSRCSSREAPSIRRCWPTSPRRRPPCTSTSSASDPGEVGDGFADALVTKAREGVPVRLVVDRQGSDPEGSTRAFYERLVGAGVEVCVVRATKPRAVAGPLGTGGATRWNLRGLGHIDHRKVVVVDGRIGWVGGAGIEDHFADGRFHDLFLRVEGPVVAQLQLVFLGGFRWLGGTVAPSSLDGLFPALDGGPSADPGDRAAQRARAASGRSRTRSAACSTERQETLDVVNPYVTDRGMIRRIERAARRGARVRLFVPANANNWACAAAQQHHHGSLLDAGVSILEYPTMLHAKAFVRDGEEVLAGTCNLEAWSLKRFFEIDLLVRLTRRSRRSSTSASAPRPRRSRRPARGSPGRRTGPGPRRSPSSRRSSDAGRPWAATTRRRLHRTRRASRRRTVARRRSARRGASRSSSGRSRSPGRCRPTEGLPPGATSSPA